MVCNAQDLYFCCTVIVKPGLLKQQKQMLLPKMPVFLDYDKFCYWKIMYKILLRLTIRRYVNNIQSTFMGGIAVVTSLIL